MFVYLFVYVLVCFIYLIIITNKLASFLNKGKCSFVYLSFCLLICLFICWFIYFLNKSDLISTLYSMNRFPKPDYIQRADFLNPIIFNEEIS